MIKFVYFCLILCIGAFFGCTEQGSESINTPEAAEAATDIIKLSEEEIDILETTTDTIDIDLGEINADNYEEALDKLEQAVDSE